MKICLVFCWLSYFFCSVSCAQSINLNFAFKIGGESGDYSRSICIGPDSVLTVLGSFDSVFDADPGSGTANLTPASTNTDIFVAQYTATGQYKRAFSLPFKDNLIDLFGDVTTDAAGNIYLTGSFRGTVDFDPGPGVTNLSAVASQFDRDCFVAKYDSLGNLQWAFKIGGSSESDRGRSLVADKEGNVYVTGGFSGTIDFNPGPAANELSSAGSYDVFVAKYNTAGEYQWAFRVGNYLFDRGESIKLTNAGNVLVTGVFYETADFAPGPATVNLTAAGLSDIFVAQYTPSGSCLWAFSVGSSDYDDGLAITSDGNNNVYVTGDFTKSADFDPGPNQTLLTASPNVSSSGFVAKYSSAGAYQWAYKIDGDPYSETVGRSISANAFGDVFLTGSFNRRIYFGSATTATNSLTTVGNRDAFIATYSSAGNLKQVFQIGSPGDDDGRSIIVDGYGRIFITGVFISTADFNPDTSATSLTANYIDGFVASYRIRNTTNACVSVKSGQWEDATTWSCQRVPLATDKVTIANTHTVTITTIPAVAGQISFQGGKLVFGVDSSRLRIQGSF